MLKIVGALLFLEPIRFAGEALRVLWTLPYRGAAAIVELIVHAAVAVIAAAAARALWIGAPDARRLGIIAVGAVVARTIQSLYWSVLPDNTRPGDEIVFAVGAVAVGAVAIVALRRGLTG